jgi:hypothetical protein
MNTLARISVVGLAFAVLGAIFLTRSIATTTTRAGVVEPIPTILMDDLHRAIDMKTLPATDLQDPV